MFKLNRLYNQDCMTGLAEIPDGYFELAIVDPPYGGKRIQKAGGHLERYDEIIRRHRAHQQSAEGRYVRYNTSGAGATSEPKIKYWNIAPSQEYFKELFRVSKNQIIWGGNYFDLPPSRCFIIWRKLTISENFTMAMCEYAWTSFDRNAKLFEAPPQCRKRLHPTQKPVALYEFCLRHFAKPGDKILDTHAGAGSCLIAAHRLGYNWLGFELDTDYCSMAQERIEQEMAQSRLFEVKPDE